MTQAQEVRVGDAFRCDGEVGRVVRVQGSRDGATVSRDHRGRIAVRNVATGRLSYLPEQMLLSMPRAVAEASDDKDARIAFLEGLLRADRDDWRRRCIQAQAKHRHLLDIIADARETLCHHLSEFDTWAGPLLDRLGVVSPNPVKRPQFCSICRRDDCTTEHACE
jgi:hypothetical protein